jgi:NAD(P)-dependent dehydrogenase (short-subunit alcohol dehydrogenase family)
VALVTGAGSEGDGVGIGRAIAVTFAREGARLALIDIRREAVEETARLVRLESAECITAEADVTDTDACRAFRDTIIQTFGRIDVLVNNVGITGPHETAADLDVPQWEAAFRTNVTSVAVLSGLVIPTMQAQGGGAIVNIGSIAGLLGGHPGLLYSTSKGAVIQMTRAMAAHHGASGIRVNCVVPGLVFTPRMAQRLDTQQREARRRRSLLQTEGTSWDVANAVLFMSSDEARWVTGTVLPVDGGITAALPDLSVPAPSAPND